MKKNLLILLIFSTSSFAQNRSYSHFRDYFISSNINSLQKVVDSQKNQSPLTYPHSLIELEMSRNLFANDFGKDLENIKSIAIQSKNQQVLATYHLLKSMKFLRIDKKEFLNSFLKAKEYFEQQKDTSGLISSNYMLLALLREPTANYKDIEKISVEFFKNTSSYFPQMNDVRDKLGIIMKCINYGSFFEMKIDEQFTFYKIGINLLIKYETEKKDVLIKNLELQKQVIEARTRLILFILVLTCIIIVALSFLAFRFYEANKKLKKVTQSRDKLFTIIAHDLRSPLNSYQRYSKIVWYLIKTKQFDRLEGVLKKNDELGLNLAALLNNLLEWSVIQQKQIQITPTIINVQAFFNDLLPIYRDMANLKDLSLIEDFQDKNIKIDPNLLSLITRNLLDNAIKYTPEGNLITLQTTIKGDVFVMTISNTGCTMTPIQTEKIKSLFNDSNDYEFGEEGLGIGLILIKEFAKTNAVKIIFDHNVTITTFEVRVTNIWSAKPKRAKSELDSPWVYTLSS